MTTVQLNMSMSLDGYVAGPDVGHDHPMGRGGDRLHDWLGRGDSPVDSEVRARTRERIAAVVIGRRMFDVGLRYWEDTPYPAPTFVVTHEERAPLPQPSATFTFVTQGVASAVEQARAAARESGGGDGEVIVMGGPDIANQCLRAGLVDEIRLQIVPVLLGRGARLFDALGTDRVELESLGVQESPHVTHLHYRIAGRGGPGTA